MVENERAFDDPPLGDGETGDWSLTLTDEETGNTCSTAESTKDNLFLLSAVGDATFLSGDSDKESSTGMAEHQTNPPPFAAGDHVWCLAGAGPLKHKHHGIVKDVSRDASGWNVTIYEYTSTTQLNLAWISRTVDFFSSKEQVTGRVQKSQRPWKDWQKVQYKENITKTNPPHVVLQRLRFILESPPKLLRKFDFACCNCECVAVWCATGRWTTVQMIMAIGISKITLFLIAAEVAVASCFITVAIVAKWKEHEKTMKAGFNQWIERNQLKS